MPARQIPIKTRQRRVPSAAPKETPLNVALKAIEIERGNLARADSLLGCLKIAMEYEDVSHEGPYYPDVAEIAREMLRKSIRALDPINLPSPSGNKVKEDFHATDGVALLLDQGEVPLLPHRIFVPRKYWLRMHRRNYSRAAARNASSLDSASANMSS